MWTRVHRCVQHTHACTPASVAPPPGCRLGTTRLILYTQVPGSLGVVRCLQGCGSEELSVWLGVCRDVAQKSALGCLYQPSQEAHPPRWAPRAAQDGSPGGASGARATPTPPGPLEADAAFWLLGSREALPRTCVPSRAYTHVCELLVQYN